MNTLRTFLVFCVFSAVLARGDEAPKYTPESRTVTETFMTKVLKVYAFQEGDAEYVAYVVNWNGHEVVVVPEGNKEGDFRFKEGDEIRCTMFQSNARQGEATKTRIRFYGGTRGVLNAIESNRLEEVAAEVKSRREKRQAVMAGMPKQESVQRGDASSRFEIQIRASGEVVIDKDVVSDDVLKEKLGAVARENKQCSVYIVASEKASAESVTKVMDMCRRLGLTKFSMATLPND